ncbi:MAG: hypothetical protein H0X47_15155 [Nitrospirales bacterium]|nr:hypothetical protein [Nitrospirales bacterium]
MRHQMISAIRRNISIVTPTAALVPFITAFHLIVLPVFGQSVQPEAN